jgi:flavorubredoxin
MANVHEIEKGIYRISTGADVFPGGLQFNQFLIADEEPLLFHTGPRRMFPEVKAAVERILPVDRLRYISFSHLEADECGSLNEWLAAAPSSVAVCSRMAAMVSVGDSADRPARPLGDGEELVLGAHRLRWSDTPHLPHGMDCGYLFEETTHTLLCGDLFSQIGSDLPPLTEGDILGPSVEMMKRFTGGFAYSKDAGALFEKLAKMAPRTLASMHGSAWRGDGTRLLLALRDALS